MALMLGSARWVPSGRIPSRPTMAFVSDAAAGEISQGF